MCYIVVHKFICTDVILHVHCIGICHCASLYINISLITSVHYSKMSKKISTKKSRLIAINSITICNLYWKTSVWHIWYIKMYLISTMFIKISFYSSHCPHSWSYSVSSASFTDSLTKRGVGPFKKTFMNKFGISSYNIETILITTECIKEKLGWTVFNL